MRLWHVDLIPYLPKQQLLGQWRECVLIAKNLAEKGTPNHVLVNRITEYNFTHFWAYGHLVIQEIEQRGYKINKESINKFESYLIIWKDNYCQSKYDKDDVFMHWHNDRYLAQCFHNLQEKYDCGAINEFEFARVRRGYELLRYGSIQ